MLCSLNLTSLPGGEELLFFSILSHLGLNDTLYKGEAHVGNGTEEPVGLFLCT